MSYDYGFTWKTFYFANEEGRFCYAVKVDPQKVRLAVEDLAASYEDADEVVRWYYGDTSRLKDIENMVLEDQVVELVLGKAKTTQESIDFKTLMAAATGSAPGLS